eukprot:5184504-Amphidinium_carterae.1
MRRDTSRHIGHFNMPTLMLKITLTTVNGSVVRMMTYPEVGMASKKRSRGYYLDPRFSKWSNAEKFKDLLLLWCTEGRKKSLSTTVIPRVSSIPWIANVHTVLNTDAKLPFGTLRVPP